MIDPYCLYLPNAATDRYIFLVCAECKNSVRCKLVFKTRWGSVPRCCFLISSLFLTSLLWSTFFYAWNVFIFVLHVFRAIHCDAGPYVEGLCSFSFPLHGVLLALQWVCVRACVCACMCVCICVCMHACACMCVTAGIKYVFTWQPLDLSGSFINLKGFEHSPRWIKHRFECMKSTIS